MARKTNFDYFDAFVKLADYSCQAAALADDTFHHFNPDEILDRVEKIHAVEHAADEQTHRILNALAKEFIPPLEIEDIADTAQMLDDVTDFIEDVVVKLYAYNIRKIHPDAIAFSEIITRCAIQMKEALIEFVNFKKSTLLSAHIIEVNRLESEGDELYNRAMHNLHALSSDPIEVLVWSRMFDSLEKCCDATEGVADFIGNIMMKNS